MHSLITSGYQVVLGLPRRAAVYVECQTPEKAKLTLCEISAL
jgi:hypothetical protein